MDQTLRQACPVCGSAFAPRTHGGGGLKIFCSKKCRSTSQGRRRWDRNPAAVMEANRKYRKANPEKIRERARARKAEQRTTEPDLLSAWQRNNPHLTVTYRPGRREARPSWLTPSQLELMRSIYMEARRLTRETGVRHHVDHIHPLRGETVCGLHVPWNLQILTASENCRKQNRLDAQDLTAQTGAMHPCSGGTRP